jgi:WD40 repeat protein
MAVAGADGRLMLWNVTDPTRPAILTVIEDQQRVDEMAFSPDGRKLAVHTWHGELTLWDLTPAKPVRLATPTGHSRINSVTFSPDGRTMAVVGESGFNRTALLWDLSNGSAPVPLAALAGRGQNNLFSVAFSPDGRTLATGTLDHTVILWDVSDRADPGRLHTLPGHSERESAVAFSPDGRTILTWSRYGTAVLWDSVRGANPVQLAVLQGDYFDMRAAVFSPDGRTLTMAGGSYGANVTVWDYTELNDLRADPSGPACAITGRGLNAKEWARHIPELKYQPTCPA